MMLAVSDKVRRQYLLLYCLVILITGIASVLVVHSDFDAFVARVKAELVREANITNVQIENNLVDVTKLLDVSLPLVTRALDEGRLTPGLAQDSYVGWAISRIQPLEASASLSKEAVMASFIREYRTLIATLFAAF